MFLLRYQPISFLPPNLSTWRRLWHANTGAARDDEVGWGRGSQPAGPILQPRRCSPPTGREGGGAGWNGSVSRGQLVWAGVGGDIA